MVSRRSLSSPASPSLYLAKTRSFWKTNYSASSCFRRQQDQSFQLPPSRLESSAACTGHLGSSLKATAESSLSKTAYFRSRPIHPNYRRLTPTGEKSLTFGPTRNVCGFYPGLYFGTSPEGQTSSLLVQKFELYNIFD